MESGLTFGSQNCFVNGNSAVRNNFLKKLSNLRSTKKITRDKQIKLNQHKAP
jgi:hypothetical protein